MDPRKDLLVIVWGVNEAMMTDVVSGGWTAKPPPGAMPEELRNTIRATAKLCKRFPRTVIFIGDHADLPLGEEYHSWVIEALAQFRQNGMYNVFEAGTLFQAMPGTEHDQDHFGSNSESQENVQRVMKAVTRFASTLFPWALGERPS